MRTRAAILSVLALGFLLSTAGAGMAITGLQANDQASVAQYPTTTTTPPTETTTTPPAPESAVLGEQAERTAPAAPPAEVLPEAQESVPVEQPARQVEAGAQASPGALPFTGFAALPVLLLGLALLSVGLVMRRSARSD